MFKNAKNIYMWTKYTTIVMQKVKFKTSQIEV